MRNIPTIYARKEEFNGVEIFSFECPKCGEVHTHGAKEGHRVAHCVNSDFFPRGYILKENLLQN